MNIVQSDLLLKAGVPHGWFDNSLGDVVFRPNNPFNDPQWISEAAMQKRLATACEALDLDDSQLVILGGVSQSDTVLSVDSGDAGKKIGPTDGCITNASELPILLAAADCNQMVIYAPDCGAMAVVHAGGLGASRQIVTKATKQLIGKYGADPSKMIVAIGPSLSAEHFIPSSEVDGFVLKDIASTNPVTKKLPDGRVGYDVTATNIRQLTKLGVQSSTIDVITIDTFTNPNWYSYERDRIRDPAAAMRRHGLFVALPAQAKNTAS